MHYRIITLTLCAMVSGCSAFTMDDKHYSVFFQPFSSALDQNGLAVVHTAAAVARANPGLPILLTGHASPPGSPDENDALSAQRATEVQHALITEGVDADRISTAGKGVSDPNGRPNLSVQRVDISIGR